MFEKRDNENLARAVTETERCDHGKRRQRAPVHDRPVGTDIEPGPHHPGVKSLRGRCHQTVPWPALLCHAALVAPRHCGLVRGRGVGPTLLINNGRLHYD